MTTNAPLDDGSVHSHDRDDSSNSEDRICVAASTTFHEPYNLARQLKTLDVISGGRMGWNAITTSDEVSAANFGTSIADRDERYGRAKEVIQIVQALWGSWQEDAWIADQKSGVHRKRLPKPGYEPRL